MYRTRCFIPKLEKDSCQIHQCGSDILPCIFHCLASVVFHFKLQDPDNLVLKVLHCENPFLRMQGRQLTFLQSCEGSYLHPVGKMRGLAGSSFSKYFQV